MKRQGVTSDTKHDDNDDVKLSSSSPHTYAMSVVVPSPPSQPEGTDTSDAAEALDFIGPSHAVKELFTLPYSTESVSVAVHNMNGTLLLERDVDQAPERPRTRFSRRRRRPGSLSEHEGADGSLRAPEETLALATSLLRLPPSETDDECEEERSDLNTKPPEAASEDESERRWVDSTQTGHLLLPPPQEYPLMPPLLEPRQYMPLHFWGHQLLVGSDVIVHRSHQHDEETAVRVADLSEMKSLLRTQQDMIQQGRFVTDRQAQKSYADALTASKAASSGQPGFAAPDLNQVTLQTCIIPSTAGPDNTDHRLEESSSTTMSPVCTVMDAYLDNIIANVPQLALCLREKGFIQSVKLFRTEDIPSSLMRASTLDGTSATVGASDETPLFSPQIMEMNASALLRFLRANCTRDNATYLLRREAGQTNIQLYDISAISAQRQRKWIWWLATMSYRFALRLGQLSTSDSDRAHRRMCRARQRSLLENSLELLSELVDMDGEAHETLCAAVRENLADTFLQLDSTGDEEESGGQRTKQLEANPFHPGMQSSQPQPYTTLPIDALSKAQDHLMEGIRILWPLSKQRRAEPRRRRVQRPVTVDQSDDDSSGEDWSDNSDATKPMSLEVTLQLFGLHHKLVHVSLRLAEHHLRNYFSSSAMQALRSSARRLADAMNLLAPVEKHDLLSEKELRHLQLSLCYQYTWVWEHCGHFARSFAADDLWRDRGHACGDDVISVLRDVELAFDLRDRQQVWLSHLWAKDEVPLTRKTNGMVSLRSLSAVADDKYSSSHASTIELARKFLGRQKQIQRDQRRVLVAACVSYSRSISASQDIREAQPTPQVKERNSTDPGEISGNAILSLLRQRFGDACNEIGKILLSELRSLVNAPPDDLNVNAARIPEVAEILLNSAEFWFMEGLESFQECTDLRNIALLRCNLCQCCKFRANSTFATTSNSSHAERCLQEGAHHLQSAHKALGEREVDPLTWDMVSEELAATFLVLGVRRRQSLLGGGTTPVIMQALRLQPGRERSIVDQMEKALTIYNQLGNAQQAAATHYQLALFYSKVWTCQRDEAKTREKLSAAFGHFSAAHAYFSRAPRGNEPTFVILCLDLSNLYSAVSGEECLGKGLSCCLDTAGSFSPEACQAAVDRGSQGEEWLEKMCTLASSVEDRVFKLLMGLVKMEKDKAVSAEMSYKELYRAALSAKVKMKSRSEGNTEYLSSLHDLLKSIKRSF